MAQSKRSQLWTVPVFGTRPQRRRATVWSVATLACIGGIAGGPEVLGDRTQALAQTTSGTPSPPDDAPIMRPGQRVRRPFGSIEITTFTRSEVQQNSIFKIEFLVRNESPKDVKVSVPGYIRLIADGVPRAPIETTPKYPYDLDVQLESAEYGDATFSVRGQPHVVHVQFGTGDAVGRSFLRWPD